MDKVSIIGIDTSEGTVQLHASTGSGSQCFATMIDGFAVFMRTSAPDRTS